jgi:hypothetical protein
MAAAKLTAPAASAPLHVATVEAVRGATVEVRGPAFGRAAARLAVPGYRPVAEDQVLVASADGGRFVVGVLRALRPVAEASDGTQAAVEEDDAGREVVRLRAPDGTVLVEHRVAEGRTVVSARALLLQADRDVEVAAGGDLRLRAAGDVRVSAGREASLEAAESGIGFRDDRAELHGGALGARLGRADLQVEEANLVARTVRTVAGRMKREIEILETRAGRVIERAKESWRETEGLSQSKAGRLRLVAEETLTVLGQSTLVKAREDVKVKGEKIHLG